MTGKTNDETDGVTPHKVPKSNLWPKVFKLNSKSLSTFFPTNRTSFITDATELSKKRAIISIAVRKGLLVFFSVHGVVSWALLALSLVGGASRRKRLGNGAKNAWRSLILKILKSSSTVRLATWLGLYSSFWTISYSFLRKNKGRLSHWSPFIAGTLSGVSLLAQSKADRKELAPNILIRGLYSIFMYRPLFPFKHSDMLLFALSNAQMAIAFLLYPSTLPKWYFNWIARVGQMNVRYVDLNRRLDRSLLLPDVPILVSHRRLIHKEACPRTWNNELRIQRWLSQPDPKNRRSATCALNHPQHDGCLAYNTHMIISTFVKMSPTYAILHLVPAVIFRLKVLFQSPMRFFLSLAKKTAASAMFLATFVSIVQNCFCLPSIAYEKYGIVVRGSLFYGTLGFLTGLSLLWEEPKRRGELALYCAPKALYSLWEVLKARNMVKSFPFGDVIVGCLGSGMLMHCFVNGPEKMPALARGMISQLVDPHTPGRIKKDKSNRKE
ncbi:hypothetical protein PPACK8108_LOCUS24189 [Phakopsora pachyrhizi]|uniref:Transmembrane protein 135 N-terminal domain-containing protein n=1 Tax=Phakopsora pachyrhizi TaxID=170000 RepID=A0AAV0BP89_PHAPC|nr:hypothetical protein PPACK8108_LOCUS24189 [Phakopsora pachyrhizi]